MLRGDGTPGRRALGIGLVAGVGALCAALVALGNPGNMGVCGACFLRDVAGALGFQSGKGPAVFRPEFAGVVLGALGLTLLRGGRPGRSGSFAVTRFVFGVWMGIAAMVFLGCPFRMLQRLGGGDLNAWFALPGFVLGVGIALVFERRGYTVGKTQPAPLGVGLLGPLAAAALLALFLVGKLVGPGPGDASGPPHAPWLAALGIAAVAGAALSATGFCAVSAARQVFRGPRGMLAAAGALVLAYGAVAAATGRFALAAEGQPAAHSDWLWNAASLALLGLAGAFAGGCPVRQIVMTGEGNGDAFVTVVGILFGGALSHNLGLVSSGAGATDAGAVAVVVGLAFSLLYALVNRFAAAPR